MKGFSMTEIIPILTVDDLKYELAKWLNETPVSFYSALREQEFRFYKYRAGYPHLCLRSMDFQKRQTGACRDALGAPEIGSN